MVGKEERAMILKMLEEGKINLEEAEILLETLEGDYGEDSWDDDFEQGEDYGSSEKFKLDCENLKEIFQETIDQAKDDLKKMKDDFEASPIKNELSDFFNSVFDNFTIKADSSFKFQDRHVGTFTPLRDSLVAIEVSIRNGTIFIEPSLNNEFELFIESTVRAVSESEAQVKKDELLEVILKEDSLLVNSRGRNIGTRVGLKLPAQYFYQLELDSSNGRIDVENLVANRLRADTSNGAISLRHLKGEDFSVDTSNGRIEMTDILGKKLVAESCNGSITIKANFLEDGQIKAEANNGKVEIFLAEDEQTTYKFEAKTAMGRIDLNIDDLEYLEQSNKYAPKSVVAVSKSQTGKNKDVQVKASTSMGSIHIGYIR